MHVDELPHVQLESLTDYEDWRVNVTARVTHLISLSRSEWPPQKGLVTDDSVPADHRTAFVLADLPEVGKLGRGQTYQFENVRVNVYRQDSYDFTPEPQIFVDRFSEVHPKRGETSSSEQPDPTERHSESPPDPLSSGKEVRTERYGERLAGKNPHNDPSRIKDAGLHQGGA